MFEALVGTLPGWMQIVLAVALVVLSIVVAGKVPGWLGTLLAAARAGALAAILPRLRLPKGEPQPLDPERDPAQPDAVAVDSAGTPVGQRDPSEYERSEA